MKTGSANVYKFQSNMNSELILSSAISWKLCTQNSEQCYRQSCFYYRHFDIFYAPKNEYKFLHFI